MEAKSLGCGRKFNINTISGFICGVANAWGEERLCEKCKLKTKEVKNENN